MSSFVVWCFLLVYDPIQFLFILGLRVQGLAFRAKCSKLRSPVFCDCGSFEQGFGVGVDALKPVIMEQELGKNMESEMDTEIR